MILLKNKKAAMFGLDARIALAIFGALSVITGVALYSTIQEVETISFINDLNELGKAWDAYYLDTNKTLPRSKSDSTTNDYYVYKSTPLVSNTENVKEWRGPYVTYKADASVPGALEYEKYKKPGVYHYINYLEFSDSPGWISNSWAPKKCVSGVNDCALWVFISGLPEYLVKNVDKKIDNGDGAEHGYFRWVYEPGYGYQGYYKLLKVRNPND